MFIASLRLRKLLVFLILLFSTWLRLRLLSLLRVNSFAIASDVVVMLMMLVGSLCLHVRFSGLAFFFNGHRLGSALVFVGMFVGHI
jgi:hypothetical protein